MKNNASNVIIKVNDIDICRSFYRNILNLGAPVVNSNFQVEFLMNNRGRVILQKKMDRDRNDDEKEPVEKIIYCAEEISTICHRLGTAGHCYEYVDKNRCGCCRLRDPDGNLLTIVGKPLRGKAKQFKSGATAKISIKKGIGHKTDRLS